MCAAICLSPVVLTDEAAPEEQVWPSLAAALPAFIEAAQSFTVPLLLETERNEHNLRTKWVPPLELHRTRADRSSPPVQQRAVRRGVGLCYLE
jgi:hypothetical protein